MARQTILPNFGFINETVARQTILPGGGFFDETVSLVNVSITGVVTFGFNGSTASLSSVSTNVVATASVGSFVANPSVNILGANWIRNSTMIGVATGTPGTLPTNWSAGIVGLSQQVVGSGISSGLPYVDIRVFGTTIGQFGGINLEASNILAANNGQTWTLSSSLAIVGGSLTNISGVGLKIIDFTSGGSFLSNVIASNLSVNATLTRFPTTGTITDPTAAYIQPSFIFSLTASSGQAVDCTFRIAAPQLEHGSIASAWIPTSGTSLVIGAANGQVGNFVVNPVASITGVVATGTATSAASFVVNSSANILGANWIRNSTMVNAGGIPTSWAFETDNGSGYTLFYTYGNENGIPYVDWRIFGTPVSATYVILFFDSMVAKAIPYFPGTTWTSSATVRMPAGSLVGITQVAMCARISTSAPVFVADPQTLFTPTTISQRISVVATSASGTAAFITGHIQVSITSGTPIDCTFRIAAPQLEHGSSATPWIATSGTALVIGAANGQVGTFVPSLTTGVSGVVATGGAAQNVSLTANSNKIISGIFTTGQTSPTVTSSKSQVVTGITAISQIAPPSDKLNGLISGISASGSIGASKITINAATILGGAALGSSTLGGDATQSIAIPIRDNISVSNVTAITQIASLSGNPKATIIGIIASGRVGVISQTWITVRNILPMIIAHNARIIIGDVLDELPSEITVFAAPQVIRMAYPIQTIYSIPQVVQLAFPVKGNLVNVFQVPQLVTMVYN